MKTRLLPINELIMADYNPRKDLRPGDDEYEKLRRSIQEFGYVSPIIINKDKTVIGGHQRYKVLKELGHEEILVVEVDMDEQHEKMLNLALNKISGDWDMEKLEELIKDISEDGYDATLTGFSLEELDDLVGEFDPLADDGDADSTTESESDDSDTVIECPSCHHVANKEEFKV